MKKSKINRLIFSVVSVIFIIAGPVNAFNVVPLIVKERANIVRTNEPVTYGVPLAEADNVTDVQHLGIFDANDQEIPAQFKVISRYHGLVTHETQPIRVVLVDFQVNQINAGQELTFYLKDSGNGTAVGADLVSQDDDHVLINTGVLNAKVSKKKFNFFDEVELGSTTVISSKPTDGIVAVDRNGVEYSSNNAPVEVVIEENGPIKAVVKVNGYFKDSEGGFLLPENGDNGISYTVRFKVFKDKSYIKADYSFENENLGWSGSASDPVHNVWITSNYIKTTLEKQAGDTTVSFSGYTDVSTGKSYQLLQTEDSDGTTEAYDWSYQIRKDGALVQTGTKYDSYLDVKNMNNGLGLLVASRKFWQNHPKGLEVDNSVVQFHVLPDAGSTHRILGGVWKTTELLYYFHDGSDSDFTNELATLKKRLVLKASDEHYSSTGFFSAMIPNNIVTGYQFPEGELLQLAIDAQKKELRSKYHLSYSDTDMGETLVSLRDKRNILIDDNKYGTWYGWLEFGDFVRGDGYGYSATHYSWPYISLKAFLRFDDYDAMEFGEEIASHAADISILHDSHATEMMDSRYHGAHRYEADALLSYQDSHSSGRAGNVRASSHFWNRGIILQYLLTGDRRYYDAAEDSIDHLETVYIDTFQCRPDASNPTACANYDVLRSKARAMHGLISFYKITGDSQHLDNSWNIFKYGILGHKKTYNQEGTIYTYYSDSPGADKFQYSALQSGVSVEGAIELYDIFTTLGDTDRAGELNLFLQQNAVFVRDVIYKSWVSADCGTYGTGAHEGKYYPYGQEKLWDPGDAWDDNEICNNCGNYGNYYALYLADLFAFQYQQTDDIDWLNLARSVFKDFYSYPTSAGYYDIANEPRSISGFTNLQSAWAKFGQRYKKGIYYLKTEWEESQKSVTAFFTVSPDPATLDTTTTFDASSSTGTISSYEWDFDDDGIIDATGPIVSHWFVTEGEYTVTLTVSDGSETSSAVKTVTVTDETCSPTSEICSDGVDQDCDGVDAICQNCGPGAITSRCDCGSSTGVESGYCCDNNWQTTACVMSCVADCRGKVCGDDNGCGEKCVVQSCGDGSICTENAECTTDIREISYIHPTCLGHSNYTGETYTASNCFTTLQAWQDGKKEDLVITDKIAVAQIEGRWINPDRSKLTIKDWVTDKDHYIKIYTTPESRHLGVWDDNRYRLEVDNGTIFYINEDNVQIDGLLMFSNYNGNHSHAIVLTNGDGSVQDLRFSNNIIRGHGAYDDNNSHFAFTTAGGDPASDSTVNIWNNIVYDFSGPTGGSGIYAQKSTRTYYINNNTFYNCSKVSISVAAATTIARNNLIVGSANPYSGNFANGTDYNGSDSDDVPGVGNYNLTNQQFLFVAANDENRDFHLQRGSAGILAGVNVSGAYSLDIDGDIRNYGPCDMGVDEWTPSQLADVILALKTVAQTQGGTTLSYAGDIDGNGKIGLAEAISAMQKLRDVSQEH